MTDTIQRLLDTTKNAWMPALRGLFIGAKHVQPDTHHPD